jgi:hypothetical protein
MAANWRRLMPFLAKLSRSISSHIVCLLISVPVAANNNAASAEVQRAGDCFSDGEEADTLLQMQTTYELARAREHEGEIKVKRFAKAA